jgi:nucleoside phosphorylase
VNIVMATNAVRGREAYTVGIVCALAIEKAAAIAMLDDKHERLPSAPGDENDYTFGTIGTHGVVIACLPAGTTGTVSTAVVAIDMIRSFPPIRIGLMVGIAGGVWSEEVDVRLGDVVVSQPNDWHGGVIQWDFSATGGVIWRTGALSKPPRELLDAIQGLQADHLLLGHRLEKHLAEMLSRYPALEKCVHQGDDNDQLFEASYDHEQGNTCKQCDRLRIIQRGERRSSRPRIHYGNIASANIVLKDGRTRDRIAQQEGVICFEMEAAGLMNSFPCVVIRGICDYADSHKNKRWQPYAAATAAAYARELLLWMPAIEVGRIRIGFEASPFHTSLEARTPLAETSLPLSDDEDSDTESVDSLFSTASLTSSLSSFGPTGLKEETIRTFVDQIFCTMQLTAVHEAALEDKAIGVERYMRNLRRMIANFGIALKSEAAVADQFYAAKVVSSRRMSERAARIIVEQSDLGRQRGIQVDNVLADHKSEATKQEVDEQIDHNSVSGRSDGDSDPDEPEDMAGEQLLAAKKFLEESHALQEYKQSVVEFVHQPYEKRIRQCLTFTATDHIDIHEQLTTQRRVDALVHEISWVPPSTFEFCSNKEITSLDILKAFVEDVVEGELDWQPFTPPTRQVPVGFVRIEWQTVCRTVMTKVRCHHELVSSSWTQSWSASGTTRIGE